MEDHTGTSVPVCVRCTIAILVLFAYRITGTSLLYCANCRYDHPAAGPFTRVEVTR